MHQRIPATLLVVLVVLAVAGSSSSSASDELLQVLVVHRHGARTPLVWANQQVLCGPAGCGTLTPAGKQMLFQLGRYVSTRYNNSLQLAAEYDPGQVVARSSDYARTVQSAEAMLCGVYNCTAQRTVPDFLPYISTVPKPLEVMLRPDKGWPTLVLHAAATQSALWDEMNNVTLSLVSAVELDAVGRELGLGGECDASNATVFQPYVCAMDAQDTWECKFTELGPAGLASTFPLLAASGAKLNAVLRQSNNYSWFAFDREHYPTYHAAIGSYGRFLASDIIERVRTRASGAPAGSGGDDPYGEGTAAGRVKLVEYSGHDVTLMTLQSTMGNETLLHPRFAAAMIFEVWNKSGVVWMRVMLGAPDEAPGAHDYTFQPFEMRCVNATSAVYLSPGDIGCPLDEFDAFVKLRDPPASAEGICYGLDADLAHERCQPTDTAPPTDACLTFRQACPLTSCGANAYLAGPTLSCVAVSENPNLPIASGSPRASMWNDIAASSVAVAVILALMVLVLLWDRQRLRAALRECGGVSAASPLINGAETQ